jgi:hypothetical protein
VLSDPTQAVSGLGAMTSSLPGHTHPQEVSPARVAAALVLTEDRIGRYLPRPPAANAVNLGTLPHSSRVGRGVSA